MAKRLAVLINPTAGRGRAIIAGRQVREELRAAGHEVFDVTAATAAAADQKLRTALRTTGLDVIVAVGGDGVVNLAASAAVENGVPLAIIPAGTGNDIARGLGIARAPRADIAKLISVLELDEVPTRSVDIGQISSDGMGTESRGGEIAVRYFLSVLTCGLDAAVNARANGMRFPSGRARYLVALAAELRRYRAYDYEISFPDIADGSAQRRKLILACVANMAYFGGGMKIAPPASADDGALHVVLVERVALIKLLWIFPRIFWGGHVRHPAVQIVRTSRLRIDWGHGQVPPPPFADGEPAGARPLDVHVRAGGLQIVDMAAANRAKADKNP